MGLLQPTEFDLRRYSEQLADDINEYCAVKYLDDVRSHLGASLIGDECPRRLWYIFRWFNFEIFSGRMLRLFDVGKRQEPLLIEYLMACGVGNFKSFDLRAEKQASFSDLSCKGHFGGSTDGLGCYYPGWKSGNFTDYIEIVVEFKTHNTQSFTKMRKQPIAVSKPKHYAQMCTYGQAFGPKHGLYIAYNKNDSDIYPEFVQLNPGLADELYRKAQDVVFGTVPPPKLALDPTFVDCKFCSFVDICHHGAPVARNCRSCVYASPADNGTWYCSGYKNTIPKEFIPQGCQYWQQIGL